MNVGISVPLPAYLVDVGAMARTAEGLGFQGTPAFIVGKFRVPGVLTMDQFTQVIADARKAKDGNKATKQGG